MHCANNEKATQKEIESRRLAWRCRRGMLELDILLQRFVSKQFDALSLAELTAFDVMLALPDNDLWEALQHKDLHLKSAIERQIVEKMHAL
jgi:antitoxin CptB